MKKIVFLISHHGSDSYLLRNALNNERRVQFFSTNINYSTYADLEILLRNTHKLSNTAAIWMEELLDNHRISSNYIYQSCKFLYLINNPKYSKATPNYYEMRLRRIYEMSLRTSGFLMFREDMFNDDKMDCLSRFLNLRTRIRIKSVEQKKYDSMKVCEPFYEKYYPYFKALSEFYSLPYLKKEFLQL